jgi:60S ribosomal subunit assembly/export protein LOC1
MPPKRSTKLAQSKPSPAQSKPKSKAAKNTANGGQIKTKRAAPTLSSRANDKKKRNYTDKELSLPTLNMITPAGVEKPRGKKKGKVFVDDAVSMRTILALVSADREGQIESKMQKARQMEEIRESRRAEMEDKEASKKKKLEDVKNGLRKKRTKSHAEDGTLYHGEAQRRGGSKRVSFG